MLYDQRKRQKYKIIKDPESLLLQCSGSFHYTILYNLQSYVNSNKSCMRADNGWSKTKSIPTAAFFLVPTNSSRTV